MDYLWAGGAIVGKVGASKAIDATSLDESMGLHVGSHTYGLPHVQGHTIDRERDRGRVHGCEEQERGLFREKKGAFNFVHKSYCPRGSRARDILSLGSF